MRCCLISVVLLAVFLRPSIVTAADQRAIFELWLNGVKKSEILVLLRGDDLLAPVKDLEAAGLQSFTGRRETSGGESYVSLRSLAPEVSFQIDEQDLSLRLTAQPSMLGIHRFDLRQNRPPNIVYSDNTSGFLNYSVNLFQFDRFSIVNEAGLTIKNALLYSALSRNGDSAVVRGLSSLTFSNRENLNRVVLGDRLTASDALGGSVIVGGIGYFREFSLDPYFVRNPGLHYSGAVATPSTADVYVNGQLMQRVPVPPGQFDLRNLPVHAGSSDTRVVLRDAFGREQEISSQYYFAAGLLKEGLHEFSYNFGARRNRLAGASWDYGPIVFLARHRLGLTNSLTAGLRLEASAAGLVSGGPSVTMKIPFGELDLALAASGDHGLAGGAAFLGYSYIGRVFNFSSSLRLLSPRYATTNLRASDERSRLAFNVFAGFPLTSQLGVSLRYTLENASANGQTQRFALSATTRLTDRISLFVNGSHSRGPEVPSNEIFTGLTFLFGQTTANLSYQNQDGQGVGSISVQKSLPVGTGFGYRLAAAMDRHQKESINSLLQYQGPYGRYEVSHNRSNGEGFTLLNAAGGIAFMGGSFFLTRPVSDGFAVIRIPGVANVRGYASNQQVGRSDWNGDILVPNLLPYYGNRLRIAPEDIPLQYSIDATERVIAPPLRGGALVVFPVYRIQRFVGKIWIEKSGERTRPSYGQLRVRAAGREVESPIGKNGEFYLENLPVGRHPATIEFKGEICGFALEIPAWDEEVVNLENVRCRLP